MEIWSKSQWVWFWLAMALTVSRPVTAILAFLGFISVLIAGLFFITDILDGLVAKWRKVETKAGNVADKTCDKAAACFLVLKIYFSGEISNFSQWLVCSLIAWELGLTLIFILYYRKIRKELSKYELKANFSGRIKIWFEALFVCFLDFGLSPFWYESMLILANISALLSLVLYLFFSNRYIRKVNI